MEAWGVAEAVLFAEFSDDGGGGVEFFRVDALGHEHDFVRWRMEIVLMQQSDDFVNIGLLADYELELVVAVDHPGAEDIGLPAGGFVAG